VAISDEEIEKALDYLRDSSGKAAKARAEKLYLDEYCKPLKALIMRENVSESLGAQEARAYADPRYKQHLEALKDASEASDDLIFMREAADAKLRAWQTMRATERAQRI
jgi:hypothetical protein